MRLIHFSITLCLIALASISCSNNKAEISPKIADLQTIENEGFPDFNIVNKKVKVEYSTMTAEMSYTSDSTLHWKTNADGIIAEGDEAVSYKKIADGIYFINWIEKNGITISQVVDFNKNKVSVFMSYADANSNRGQRSGAGFEGKLSLLY